MVLHRLTPSWPALRGFLLLALAAVAITAPGCSCRQETPQERAAREAREEEEAERRRQEEEKKKRKPPLEVQDPIPQPGPDDITALVAKPGHWMTARQSMKPNYEDWVGEVTLQVVDSDNQPIPVDRTAFAVRSARDVALSKEQPKDIESVFFVPAAEGSLLARSTLRERGASLTMPPTSRQLTSLAPHQHHLVVLATEPGRYQFLGSLNSIRSRFPQSFDLPSADPTRLGFETQFHVVLAPVEDRLPLPENPLCWTSVAYLLWDEVDPELLNPTQRTALVDWVHWGGQLIISGPDSLDLLRDSFLAPYLPADSGGARTITAGDLAPLNAAWNASRNAPPIEPLRDWSGVTLNRRPEAQPAAGVAKLFAERRVGRGRLVVSAMQISERELVDWEGGFENLFNNLLLRRQPRRFAWQSDAYLGLDDAGAGGVVYEVRPTGAGDRITAGDNSKLHWFSRDTHATRDALSYVVQDATEDFGGAGAFGAGGNDPFEQQTLNSPAAIGGVGGWNDFNAVAVAARAALREAAGVNVPNSAFVMLCLAIYLTVLAPFNWLIFKALGRVELAWVAAPVIALLGTWVVVRQAQLDIGFVRAQAEVAVLELQPEHPRGHLTRYLSFYTSLSTTYDLEFADPTSLAAPFARGDSSPLRPNEQPTIVTFDRQERARLEGMTVSSNTTDMAHAEQMVELGGALRFDAKRRRLTNATEYDFSSVAVVRRPANNLDDSSARLEGCWIGDVDARSSVTLSFTPADGVEGRAPFADRRVAEGDAPDQASAGSPNAKAQLDLEPLFGLALDPARMEPGEVRAVGLVDKVLPGVEVTPEASQLRGATMVVAHLRYDALPPPKSDLNAPVDVRRTR